MTKKFKNLDWCEAHNDYYHWKYGCNLCKRSKANNTKPIDQVLKEMEQEGLIPKTDNEKNNVGDVNN